MWSTKAYRRRQPIVQQEDYLPYGEKCRNITLISGENDYLYGGKEFQAPVFNIPWYDSQARFQTTDGMFVSLDPQCEKYYSISPYAYCAGNPVRYVDRDGKEASTHTDQLGRVIAVYNDGDLGVYRHYGDKEETLKQIEKEYSSTNTSAGGVKMGESLQTFSFAENTVTDINGSATVDDITIDFNSTALTEAVQAIIDADPSVIEYMKNAKSGGDWDLKTQPEYKNKGSLLFGKYASPRDAGNFAAGFFSASNGCGSPIIDFGYGFYNISGNNTTRTVINALYFVSTPIPLPMKKIAFQYIRFFGEDPISRISQNAGKQYYNTH